MDLTQTAATVAVVSERPLREFRLDGLPSGWLAFVALLALVGLCYAVVWMYRREGRAGASVQLRTSLAALRCGVILLLAAVWVNPVLATFIERTVTARVAVLVDASASMAISDAADPAATQPAANATRLAQVQEVLTREQGAWLRRIAQRNDLSLFAYGDNAVRLQSETPAAPPPSASQPSAADLLRLPAHNRTDLGQAVTAALDDAGESRIAGIVVFSDGAINRGMAAEDLAAYLRRRQAPVYAVGVGAAQEPPNARVTNVAAPATAARSDPFEVRVELSASGVPPTPARLELVEVNVSSGAEKTIAARDVLLDPAQPPPVLPFRIANDTAGEYVYRARLDPLPGEAITQDNVRVANVTVSDSRLRVLIVAGRPTFDYRAVERLLERDATIDVSCWLQSAHAEAIRDGDIPIVELPRKPEDLLAYDAILLIDPNPAEFDSSLAITLRRFVDEFGGGLLLQAGPHFTTRFLKDPRLGDLVAMLPIVPEPDADVRLSEEGAFRTKAHPLEVPGELRSHPLLQLHSSEAANLRTWAALPGVYWYLPVEGVKPLATVTLRHSVARPRGESGGAPLMAVQPFGAGRVLFLGFDTTWRWRATAEPQFNRFWIQVVRYLAQVRTVAGNKRGAITLDRDAVNVGEYVKIEARVLDELFAAWTEPTVEAIVELPDGGRRPLLLSAIPGRDGWYSAQLAIEQEGTILLRVPLPGPATTTQPDAPENNLRKYIRANRPDVEMRTLRLHEDVLRRLAEETGGRYLTLAEAERLPESIEKATEVTPIAGPKLELWDRGWLLFVLALLLGAEWFVRRRNHLL